ncbi:MAG: hypothetical protein A2289_13900 [Deltaproteobacteria bacterium RIFOXYA12_FULL_58_15]|nr:MAG: hypothetical protein A2289_13900 [Deltaproteobacteria bacterium RIFOXYA12_FULL_58_15]OGR09598.1 MAG: hypothetical protein A2341_16500 [Deltaproteobacteria bacterium RIFOXYB12_FULL_58_9]
MKVPVSMSQSVLDQHGEIIPPERQEVLGHFETEVQGYGIMWTLAPLGKIDFSDQLNARVAELGGEAVVRLRCHLERNVPTNSFLWINMLPIWPGIVRVRVDADIVRVVPQIEGRQRQKTQAPAVI